MTQVANNPGEFSLGSNGDSSGWIPADASIDDIAFNITGTWLGTIALQVSNQSDVTKTRISTVTSYTANQPPLNMPREIGRFFRLIFTAYTSGTAYVGISKGRNPNGEAFNLAPQGTSSDPSGLYS